MVNVILNNFTPKALYTSQIKKKLSKKDKAVAITDVNHRF